MCIRDSDRAVDLCGRLLARAGVSGLRALNVGVRRVLALEPVSYTHLDVYKRQVMRFPLALTSDFDFSTVASMVFDMTSSSLLPLTFA